MSGYKVIIIYLLIFYFFKLEGRNGPGTRHASSYAFRKYNVSVLIRYAMEHTAPGRRLTGTQGPGA